MKELAPTTSSLREGMQMRAGPKDPVQNPRLVDFCARSRTTFDAFLIGTLAFVVSAWGSMIPWFWNDEAATISASTRSFSQLWKMLPTIDAQQGLYYSAMHVWYLVFPANEFSARLPSAVAVGLAAAGVVVLGQQTSDRTVALTAGVIFAVLPRVTFAGSEARSYALTITAAVWLTVFCLLAAQQERLRWWVGYGVLLVGATLFNVYLLLIVPAHAVLVLEFATTRRTFRRWLTATTGAVVALAPFLIFVLVTFPGGGIQPLNVYVLTDVLIIQYFDRYPAAIAAVTGTLLLAGLAIKLRAGNYRPSGLTAVTLTWIAFPTALLIAISLVSKPIYVARYLTFTTPALALLLGLCVATIGQALPSKWIRTGISVMLVLFVVAATPNYLAQRVPHAKPGGGLDYKALAQIVSARSTPGDCLAIDDSPNPKWPWPQRRNLILRPEIGAKLRDLALVSSAAEANTLYDTTDPISKWADKLQTCTTVWTIASRDDTLPAHQQGLALPPGPELEKTETYDFLKKYGFRIAESWQLRSSQLALFVR